MTAGGRPPEGSPSAGSSAVPSELDWRAKGLWLPDDPVSAEAFAATRPDLFDGPFAWPVLTMRESAVRHNIAAFAGYLAGYGVRHAPHGKTTMAPSLIAAQLAAGAWGITAATAHQALVLRRFGVPRVLLANELLDPRALRWAHGETQRGWKFGCYADSVDGVRMMSAALAGAPGDRPLDVLVELGHPGGRTGCRDVAGALAVAAAVIEAPTLRLAGVAGYEGGLPDPVAVRGFLRDLRGLAGAVPVPPDGPLLLSAGGSAYVDLVLDELAGAGSADRPVEVVVRSGAYVTHDDGFYAARSPLRAGSADRTLVAALRVWAQVLSTPEPGLAIVGMGKRDVSFDEGLPVPLRVRGLDGTVRPAGAARVTALNDQHGYLDVADSPVAVGELVCFGISHPCTAFDKWRVIPVVDEDDRVVDLLHTYF